MPNIKNWDKIGGILTAKSVVDKVSSNSADLFLGLQAL